MEENFENNNNFGEKKGKKILIGVILSCVLVIALIGIITYYVINNKESKDNNTNDLVIYDTNNVENTQNVEDTNTVDFVKKLFEEEDWVFVANYEKNVVKQSFKDGYGQTYLAENIEAPFINIDSDYAEEVNDEIKGVFDEAVSVYNEAAEESLDVASEEFFPVDQVESCKFKSYINDDYLSVILIYQAVGTAVIPPDYYIYNIDLKTGDKLSYEEIYTKAGFKAEDIDSKVETAIEKVFEKEFASINFDTDDDFGDRDTCIKNTFENYQDSIADESIQYFLSEDNKLNINVTFYVPIESGEVEYVLTIE